MGDVLAFLVLAVLCLVAFVVRTARADSRAGYPVHTSRMDAGGRLLVAAAVLSVLCGVGVFVARLFSG